MKDQYTDEEVAAVCGNALWKLICIQGDHPTGADMELQTRVSMLRSGYTPEEIHENWCDTRRDEGWIWGPDLDHDRKEDPRLVKYYDLPVYLRRRIEVIYGIILSMSLTIVP